MIGLVNLFMRGGFRAPHVKMDVSEITPHVFVGTDQCCLMHYKLALLDKGVNHDISLEGEMVDSAYGADSYLWLPTPDHQAPSLNALRLGVSHMDKVIAQEGKVYLHCKNGHGRAPTLAAAWLISHGMKVSQAIALIREHRMEAHIEAVQEVALHAFADANEKVPPLAKSGT